MKFKSIPQEEKPRERLEKYGVENLSNEELLAIILKTGSKKQNVKELANNILCAYKSIKNLKDLRINNLIKIDGIGRVKAIELLASLELGRRVYEDNKYQNLVKLTSPATIIDYFHTEYKDKKQEIFTVLYLDNQKNYLDKKELFKGTVNYSLVHPREIFKEAYLLSASYIVCIHNHPSGDATPSKNDIELTRKIKELGILHGITLMDHIVIGDNNYYSFYEDNNL